MISRRQRRRLAWLPSGVGALVLAGVAPASAHEGPPFPVLMDKPAGQYVVSVWADPDIGEAQFYIVVETPDGEAPVRVPQVSMWTKPVSGRLERVEYPMQRRALRKQVQFEAEPYFDQRDLWTVGFQVVDDFGRRAELTTQVESTPPGYGPWDLAIYLFPFLLLGGMWVIAMLRRWKHPATSQSANPCSRAKRINSAVLFKRSFSITRAR